MESNLIQVEVFNNSKKVFEGSLYEWFEQQQGGEFADLVYSFEICIPLMTCAKKEINYIDFATGEWIIKVI